MSRPSSREEQKRRREIERAVEDGQLSQKAADKLLEALKHPPVIKE